jgi:hypothetical protein
LLNISFSLLRLSYCRLWIVLILRSLRLWLTNLRRLSRNLTKALFLLYNWLSQFHTCRWWTCVLITFNWSSWNCTLLRYRTLTNLGSLKVCSWLVLTCSVCNSWLTSLTLTLTIRLSRWVSRRNSSWCLSSWGKEILHCTTCVASCHIWSSCRSCNIRVLLTWSSAWYCLSSLNSLLTWDILLRDSLPDLTVVLTWSSSVPLLGHSKSMTIFNSKLTNTWSCQLSCLS